VKPIELSYLHCNLDIYKLLKQYYADDSRCEFWSTYGNCINMLKYFKEEHITLDCISKKMSYSAMLNNSFEKMDILGVSSAFVASSLVSRNTLLHLAIVNSSIKTVRSFIEHYPNLMKCKNIYGITPMLWSVIFNRTEIFQLMIHRLNKDRCEQMNFEYLYPIINLEVYLKSIGIHNVNITAFICPTDWTFNEIASYYKRDHMIELVMKERLVLIIKKHLHMRAIQLIHETRSQLH